MPGSSSSYADQATRAQPLNHLLDQAPALLVILPTLVTQNWKLWHSHCAVHPFAQEPLTLPPTQLMARVSLTSEPPPHLQASP